MTDTMKFYGSMAGATIVNFSHINEILQLIIVILSIVYAILKLYKQKRE